MRQETIVKDAYTKIFSSLTKNHLGHVKNKTFSILGREGEAELVKRWEGLKECSPEWMAEKLEPLINKVWGKRTILIAFGLIEGSDKPIAVPRTPRDYPLGGLELARELGMKDLRASLSAQTRLRLALLDLAFLLAVDTAPLLEISHIQQEVCNIPIEDANFSTRMEFFFTTNGWMTLGQVAQHYPAIPFLKGCGKRNYCEVTDTLQEFGLLPK
jgi:hypothetical protein